MRLTHATKAPQIGRFETYASEVAFFYSLREQYERFLVEHRGNVWWRRWAIGGRLHERYLIRRIRQINRQLHLTNLGSL